MEWKKLVVAILETFLLFSFPAIVTVVLLHPAGLEIAKHILIEDIWALFGVIFMHTLLDYYASREQRE